MFKKFLSVIACFMAITILMTGCAPSTHVEKSSPSVEESIEESTSESEVNSSEELTEDNSEDVANSNGKDDVPASEQKGDDSEVEETQPESTPEPSQPAVEDTKTQQDESANVQTSTTTVTGIYHYEEAKKVLSLVNEYRKANGLNELVWDESLASAAKTRAAEASICWSHTRPNGTNWYTVSDLVKGENLAKGYATAEETFNAWLASDGHRENILWPEFNTVYVAYFEAENGWFWAQEFGY